MWIERILDIYSKEINQTLVESIQNKSIATKEIFIPSFIYKVMVGSKLDFKKWVIYLRFQLVKKYILNNQGRKKFHK